MPRRYRRRHRYTLARPLKTAKYSSETYTSQLNIAVNQGPQGVHGQFMLPVLPNAIGGVLGTRKAKNFTLRVCAEQTLYTDVQGNQGFDRARVAFALVFVPEGTNPSNIQFGAQQNPISLYEPNQNVILTGLVDSNQTYSFKTRLARNLNAGDEIVLILYDLTAIAVAGDSTNTPITVTCNYAISF